MAGGKGTRLGSLTKDTPKSMLKVAGRPILERLVLHLISNGIRKIFLAVNHLSHVIEHHFGDGDQYGCSIAYLIEEKPLGSGGALSLLPESPAAPILLMNGDLIFQTDLGMMLDYHDENDYFATMGVRPYLHNVPFGCVQSNQDGELVKFEEKPTLKKQINAGVYVLSPLAVATVPGNQTEFPITQLFEDALTSHQRCGLFTLDDEWLDIGRPAQLKHARGE
jgi:NDP-sugar pyrophosphorylase family protein